MMVSARDLLSRLHEDDVPHLEARDRYDSLFPVFQQDGFLRCDFQQLFHGAARFLHAHAFEELVDAEQDGHKRTFLPFTDGEGSDEGDGHERIDVELQAEQVLRSRKFLEVFLGWRDVEGIQKLYFNDVYDHLMKLVEMLESYREFSSDIRDNYLSINSDKMNNIMMTLTVITTIFMPLTFIAGLYGMNFVNIIRRSFAL